MAADGKKGITVEVDAALHAEITEYLQDHGMTVTEFVTLGLGIMLAANEVPRIAQQFGLDSSVRVNMMSVVHATTTAVNLPRGLARSVR